MKILDSNQLSEEFLFKAMASKHKIDPKSLNLIEFLINGIITQEKPSVRKIHQKSMPEESLRTYYRKIHTLSRKMPFFYSQIIENLQNSPLSIKKSGVISIDEHLIEHFSDKMEGVDYFKKSKYNKAILAHSIISSHYFHQKVEYPVSFQFYRRDQELVRWSQIEQFKTKNEIARSELEKICNIPKYKVS